MGDIIVLGLAGLVLAVAEMFLPGMIAGIMSVFAFLLATFLSYSTYGYEIGNLTLGGFMLLCFVLFICGLYVFPRSAFARKMTLSASSAPGHPDYSALLGMEGVALTQLRPSGMALIGGKRVDVLAQSGFIGPHERVKVLQTEGLRVVVRKQ